MYQEGWGMWDRVLCWAGLSFQSEGGSSQSLVDEIKWRMAVKHNKNNDCLSYLCIFCPTPVPLDLRGHFVSTGLTLNIIYSCWTMFLYVFWRIIHTGCIIKDRFSKNVTKLEITFTIFFIYILMKKLSKCYIWVYKVFLILVFKSIYELAVF